MERTYTAPPKTLFEVFESLPEGTPAQLINNQIVMSPAPSDAHQETLIEISTTLHQFVKKNGLGKMRTAPYDVYLSRRNAYQPDIVFVANENLHKIQPNGLHGAPDLVIEILSPATWRFDKEDKKDEYERSGVKEYWMVEPLDKTTEGFRLVGDQFQPLPTEEQGKLSIYLLNFSLTF